MEVWSARTRVRQGTTSRSQSWISAPGVGGLLRALAFTAFLLSSRPSAAADWPSYRGPNLDGIVPGETIRSAWPSGGPPIVWNRYLGQGYSSITIVNGRGYTLYQSAFQQHLLCFDIRGGETLWETSFGPTYEQLGLYPGPRSTPAAADGRLLFVSPDTVLHCADIRNGRDLWTVDLGEKFQGKGTEFGYSASPLVRGGKVIVPVGGEGAAVVAFDLATGEVVWKSGSVQASYASCLPIRLEGRDLIATSMRNHLLLHDPDTGRILLQHQISEGYDEHSVPPLYAEPILIVAAPFRAGATALTLSIKPGDDSQPANWSVRGDHRWHTRAFSNDVAASVIVDGALYGFDLRDQQAKAHRPSRGTFRCLDVSSGEVLWSSELPGHAGVLAADGKLILFNDAGELILLRADRTRYVELGRTTVFQDEICWTAPALSDGRLYLRTQSRLAAVDLAQHSTSQTSSRATTAAAPSPRPVWSRFRLGTLLGGEREHPFMRPERDELWDWYRASVLFVWLPASVLAMLARLFRRKSPFSATDPPAEADLSANRSTPGLTEPLLWIVLGLSVTPILNVRQEAFTFTWPAALYGGLLLVVAANRCSKGLLRRACDLGFLGLCLFYFAALRSQSLPHEWAFLLGLIPAAPFAWLWARLDRSTRTGRILSPVATLAGFTALFCAAPLWPYLH
jgi:outer membrane protein assembly factor BamB